VNKVRELTLMEEGYLTSGEEIVYVSPLQYEVSAGQFDPLADECPILSRPYL
jgi:hypothetical protein